MIYFLATRLLRALLTILLVIGFAFVVLRLSGDPAMAFLSNDAPPEALEAFRSAWGLDQPVPVQFFNYIMTLLHGDLGQSMRDGRDASTVVFERIPITLAITIPALLIHLAIGIPAGVLAALHRDTVVDRGVMMLAIGGFTIPSFILGLVLVLVFSVWLGWLPSGGAASWRHALLPIATLGVGGAATLARYTRGALLEVLNQPFMRTASAKGVPWRAAVLKHALPNAAIPTVTIVGFMVGQLIAGAVLVENVFSWPGIGRLLVSSVSSRDLAVVQCLLFLVTVTMIASSITVDILYGILDPRTRRPYRKGAMS